MEAGQEESINLIAARVWGLGALLVMVIGYIFNGLFNNGYAKGWNLLTNKD